MAEPSNPHQIALIPEYPSKHGGRLGRHIHFDERSRAFAVAPRKAAPIVNKLWDRSVKPFNQGNLGSCTGNGAVGVLCTAPFKHAGTKYNEGLARKVYSQATKDDTIAGNWPPQDTGSTVLAAMKALKDLGYISGYQWCFGLDDVLKTLSSRGPVEIGVNWYEGFDTPAKSNGLVKISGSIRGGHAFELLGIDADKKLVIAENSWGTSWGLNGRFVFSWKDLDRLLKEQGEAATVN